MVVETLGLDAAFIERLDRVTLLARRRGVGSNAGPRRSRATGSSVEFADFRTYAAGDDFRRVDWNAYARLERLFLRIYEAEENTTVTIFLDCSESMTGGNPSKALMAKQLAASLAYVALTNDDRVAVAAIGDRLIRYLPPRSGRARAPEVWRFIAGLSEGGPTTLESLALYSGYRPAAGISFVCSDMLTDGDWRRGLRALQGSCKQDVTLLQILAAEEIDPTIVGDRTLVDSESGAQVELSESSAATVQYRAAFIAYTEELRDWCRRASISFAQLSSNTPIEDVVMRVLTRIGAVQ